MIFSYGTTDSGKSFTIFGTEGKEGIVKNTLDELINIQNSLNILIS